MQPGLDMYGFGGWRNMAQRGKPDVQDWRDAYTNQTHCLAKLWNKAVSK